MGNKFQIENEKRSEIEIVKTIMYNEEEETELLKQLFQHKYPEENFIEFSVKENDSSSLNLFTYRFPSKQKQPLCVLILFHGLNSHLNSSSFLAESLSSNNICVVGYDQRGHGRSEGLKSYILDFDILISDAKIFIEKIRQLYPDKKIFIGGLSMGGLITYRLALENPEICDGVILFAPSLKVVQNSVMKFIGINLGKVIPKLQTFKADRSKSSKHRFCIEMNKNDPLNYNEGVRMGTIKSILQNIDEIEKTFSNFTSKFLVIFGGNDKTIDASVGVELIKNSKSKDKTMWYYPNMCHDVWKEIEIFNITPKLIDWIKLRNK